MTTIPPVLGANQVKFKIMHCINIIHILLKYHIQRWQVRWKFPKHSILSVIHPLLRKEDSYWRIFHTRDNHIYQLFFHSPKHLICFSFLLSCYPLYGPSVFWIKLFFYKIIHPFFMHTEDTIQYYSYYVINYFTHTHNTISDTRTKHNTRTNHETSVYVINNVPTGPAIGVEKAFTKTKSPCQIEELVKVDFCSVKFILQYKYRVYMMDHFIYYLDLII